MNLFKSNTCLVEYTLIFNVPSISSSMAAPLLGNDYAIYIPQPDPSDNHQVIKKYELFEFIEALNATPWHVPSPLNLAPAAAPLPKFKDYLPKFSTNEICTAEENLIAFSNACHNIGANTNDVCMRLFVNTLDGRVFDEFSICHLVPSPLGKSYAIGFGPLMENNRNQTIFFENTITWYSNQGSLLELSTLGLRNCIISYQI